jgi:hypothetical protein
MNEVKKDEYEFLGDKNILVLKPFFLKRIQNSTQDLEKAIKLVTTNKYPNVLGDFRGSNVNFTLWGTVEMPKLWKILGMSKNVKVAALMDEINQSAMLRMNALYSHGFRVNPFTDYEKAIEWLLE